MDTIQNNKIGYLEIEYKLNDLIKHYEFYDFKKPIVDEATFLIDFKNYKDDEVLKQLVFDHIKQIYKVNTNLSNSHYYDHWLYLKVQPLLNELANNVFKVESIISVSIDEQGHKIVRYIGEIVNHPNANDNYTGLLKGL